MGVNQSVLFWLGCLNVVGTPLIQTKEECYIALLNCTLSMVERLWSVSQITHCRIHPFVRTVFTWCHIMFLCEFLAIECQEYAAELVF